MLAWPDEAFWTQADAIAALKAEDYPRFKRISEVVGRRSSERAELDKVEALIRAGWIPDLELFDHHPDLDPWQWAWRRPSRRPGRPGMRFGSTGHAYNAMMKEPKTPE
jgi:hypothetical protein